MDSSPSWKRRHTVLAVIFLAWMVSYMDRMVMATAIPYIAKDWHLSPIAMGGVMSFFFIGYASAQIPGGILCDKFGSRFISTIGLVWWSVFTAFTGMVNGLGSMLAVRVLFGVGEGIFPPAAFKSVSVWFPRKQRGRAQAWMVTSNTLGPAIAPMFVAGVMSVWGWRSVYYSLLVPGLVVAWLVWAHVRDKPEDSVGITPEELAEINETGNRAEAAAESTPLSFWQTMVHPSVWKTFFVLGTLNITLWGFGAWLPSYLVQAKHLSLARVGVQAGLPFVAGTVGLLLGGWLSDKKFANNRRIPIIIGTVPGALFLCLMFTVQDNTLATVYQMLAGFWLYIALGAVAPLPLATIPRSAAGRAMGIVNTAGQIAGFISPLMIGIILQASGNNYNYAFGVLAVAALASAAIASTIRQR